MEKAAAVWNGAVAPQTAPGQRQKQEPAPSEQPKPPRGYARKYTVRNGYGLRWRVIHRAGGQTARSPVPQSEAAQIAPSVAGTEISRTGAPTPSCVSVIYPICCRRMSRDQNFRFQLCSLAGAFAISCTALLFPQWQLQPWSSGTSAPEAS